ncbi:MAG: hypothetical protein ABSG59_10025 [Verrucomicrobiota bacterium]|jgi:hypothetical protein
MARWYTANVLQTSITGRRLWQLSAQGERFTVQGQKALLENEAPPAGVGAKDWQTLFRGKLNIAWMPAEKVFLRAVQMPAGDAVEIRQMVELQLEKLSPLPVTHIVWSFYLLPRPADKPEALQTVIVIIAARSVVEDFLGKLEGEGYVTDRLEAPGLDQLLAAEISEEGVWIFAGAEGEPALVVWWQGGTVQHLALVALPMGAERGARLKTQLQQMAWAGEVEGWLPGPPKIHLVAGGPEARYWESVFKEAGEQIDIVAPAAEAQLAALSAERCANNSTGSNLVPSDFATRYRQQFVDGLWLRGLTAVFGAYIIGVIIYFGALYGLKMQYDRVRQDLKGYGINYTNALKDYGQIQILMERQELKYKGLDCWRAVAENMSESITLENMYFQRGKLELRGTVPTEERDAVDDFNEKMRRALNPNQENEPLFTEVSAPNINSGRGNLTDWSFNCQMKVTENE